MLQVEEEIGFRKGDLRLSGSLSVSATDILEKFLLSDVEEFAYRKGEISIVILQESKLQLASL